ncbi:hypothetical protein F4779DRAFT_218221 [Xylariaceae sp. FL0662B]|nr:hypothetical protein F4779DRAFT_218221 [Xylariaceae sp. FL0662B]
MVSLQNIELIIDQTSGSRPSILVSSKYSTKTSAVDIAFRTQSASGEYTNGTCRAIFEDIESSSFQGSPEHQQTLFLMKTRISQLQSMADAGQAHRLHKPVAYKLWSPTFTYSEQYQGMDEVILAYDCLDAVATIKPQAITEGVKFMTNPYWIDSVTHSSAFVLNNGLRYGDELLCVATYLEEWRFLSPLSLTSTYKSYVCIQENPQSSTVSGSCYVFDTNDKLVQAASGFTFKKVKKAMLTKTMRDSTFTLPAISPMTSPVPRAVDFVDKPYYSQPSADGNETSDAENTHRNSKSGLSRVSANFTSALTTPASEESPDIIGKVLSMVVSEIGYRVE